MSVGYGAQNTIQITHNLSNFAFLGIVPGSLGPHNYGEVNYRNFAPDGGDLTPPHEVGHMLGLPDDPVPGGLMWPELAGSGAQLREWYVDTILRWAGMSGRECGCGEIRP